MENNPDGPNVIIIIMMMMINHIKKRTLAFDSEI